VGTVIPFNREEKRRQGPQSRGSPAHAPLGSPAAGRRLLHTAEASSCLGISRRELMEHVHSGRIAARKIGKRWKIRACEVERFSAEIR
jgi:excisionase family DNA binding protein